MSKIQVGNEGRDKNSKSKIIKLNSKDESVHTRKGIEEFGLQPEITEDIHKMLKESRETGKPVQPLKDVEKDTSKVDSGSRKGFFYAIFLEPATKKYKGFATCVVRERNENKEYKISIETSIRDNLTECGKEIQSKIDLAYIGYGLNNLVIN